VKIDDSIKKTAGLNVGTTQAKPSKGPEKAGADKTSSDSVQLSTQVSNTSVFDANKVAEIKAAISDGSFKVNTEKVADNLLDTVKDFIHTRKA
jgi:negative regulator of flagellin synthesis FlgM